MYNPYQKTMTFEGQRVKIYYRDKNNNFHYLNPYLIKQQKLTWLEVERIIDLHKEKDQIISTMNCCRPDSWLDRAKCIKYLKHLAKKVTKLEYELQTTWHFKKDRKFHRFWELPHCSCPQMDNEDRYPSSQYVINDSCILHGRIK